MQVQKVTQIREYNISFNEKDIKFIKYCGLFEINYV
jgi:hypothetical protein